jgi:signal transduction histidine kinase
MFDKKHSAIIIIVLALVISYLHYSTLPHIHDLHNIFTELYYIPLMLGAVVFGLKGAIATFFFISLLYIPFIIVNWTDTFSFAANKFLHALFSGSFAFLAGTLIDREKRRRKQSEKEQYLAGLGRTAAAIVHDLKNPIIAIQGFTRRIQEKKGNIETSTKVVLDSANKMQKIASDVLDFAKPIKIRHKEEDMKSVIQEVCGFCKSRADNKEVALSLELPSEPVLFMIDKIRLERAIMNLINNAIDASRHGNTVKISAQHIRNLITIKIRDYGLGMDKEILENIFIPFYSKNNNGTGIGMAIAKKIIEGHQGKISVNSHPGSGTEVIVALPYN